MLLPTKPNLLKSALQPCKENLRTGGKAQQARDKPATQCSVDTVGNHLRKANSNAQHMIRTKCCRDNHKACPEHKEKKPALKPECESDSYSVLLKQWQIMWIQSTLNKQIALLGGILRGMNVVNFQIVCGATVLVALFQLACSNVTQSLDIPKLYW